MARGIAAANAREATLESPAAVQALEASREQFSGIGRSDALELATSAFGDLMSDERDGLQLRAGERVTGFRSPTVAVVEDDDGEQSLILGSDPLAVRDDGRLRRLDPTLTETTEGFAPERPAAALEIPEVASEFLTVGERAIGVRSTDARAVTGTVAEDRVFYPSVAADTDFVVAPTRAGAQVMWQLRSVDAPQELGVDLELPDGASLRLASPITTAAGETAGSGDAEIVKDGIVVSTISAPVALDANGSGVPASFLLRDGKLVVTVPHRAEDVRYPVMVDPEVRDVWGNAEFAANCGGGPANFAPGRWSYGQYGAAFTPICGQEWAGSGNGLYIRSEGGTYNNGSVAQWAWPAPQGSYIISTWFDGLRHGVAGSHLFTGLYGSGAWGAITNHPQEIVWADWTENPDSPYRSWGAYFGLFMDGTYSRTNWGWAGVRGVNIRLGDLVPPVVVLEGVSTGLDRTQSPQVARWVDDTQTPISVSAYAADEGLGLQDVGVERQGGGWYGGPHHGCIGHRASPCPRSWRPTFQLNQLPEGRNSIHTWARDIVDNIAPGRDWIQRIDRGAPQIQLTGEMVDHATDGTFSANPELYIHVTDGSATPASAVRSGVKRIQVSLDGSVVSAQTQVNPATTCDSCSLGQTWAPAATSLKGPHTVVVQAWDYLGHVASRTLQVRGLDLDYLAPYLALTCTDYQLKAPLGEPWSCLGTDAYYGSVSSSSESDEDDYSVGHPVIEAEFPPDEDEAGEFVDDEEPVGSMDLTSGTSSHSFWTWTNTGTYGVGAIIVGKVLIDIRVGLYGPDSRNFINTRRFEGPDVQMDMMIQCKYARNDFNCSAVHQQSKWYTDLENPFRYDIEHDLGYRYYSNFNVWLRSRGMPGRYLHLGPFPGFPGQAIRSNVFVCRTTTTRCQYERAR